MSNALTTLTELPANSVIYGLRGLPGKAAAGFESSPAASAGPLDDPSQSDRRPHAIGLARSWSGFRRSR